MSPRASRHPRAIAAGLALAFPLLVAAVLRPAPGALASEPIELVPLATLGDSALAVPAALQWPVLGRGQLWVTDGTGDGTFRLLDLGGFGVLEAVAVGHGIYFAAHTPAAGYELWWTDGTRAGTRLVRDLRPGPESSMPAFLGTLGPVLLFAADDGVHGRELWRSNGTRAGTRLVRELRAGPPGGLPSWKDHQRQGARLAGVVYFAGIDAAHGRELWRTDGSSAGTWRVRDIVPGPVGGQPRQLTAAVGHVFFVAYRPATGNELWATDGTQAGTVLLRDIAAGPTSSRLDLFGRVPGGLVFGADAADGLGRALWSSDGTRQGTRRIHAVQPRYQDSWSGPSLHALLPGHAVFAAKDGSHGLEPWTTNGTPAGTRLLEDIAVGPDGSNPMWFGAGEVAFFLASLDSNSALWATDGTPAGTLALRYFPQGGPDEMTAPVRAGDRWLFSLYGRGVHSYLIEAELWTTDGTPDGTHPVLVER